MISDFESTVNENRDAAMAALKNVEDIERKITQAATKTRESFDAMNGADTSANLALTVARDAQQVTAQMFQQWDHSFRILDTTQLTMPFDLVIPKLSSNFGTFDRELMSYQMNDKINRNTKCL